MVVEVKRTIFLALACGWFARNVFEWPEIFGGPVLWLSSAGDLITGLLLGVTFYQVVFKRPKPGPAPRADFDTELDAYLRRNDYSLITNEQVASLKLGTTVRANPYVHPTTAVFVNEDVINKLIQDWPKPPGRSAYDHEPTLDPLATHVPGAGFTSHPDKAHRETCSKRWNIFGICSCPIFHNAAQERQEGQEFGTSDLVDRLARWQPGGLHAQGCPARGTPTGMCACGEGT